MASLYADRRKARLGKHVLMIGTLGRFLCISALIASGSWALRLSIGERLFVLKELNVEARR